jgi:hypothetical protein
MAPGVSHYGTSGISTGYNTGNTIVQSTTVCCRPCRIIYHRLRAVLL